MDYIEREAAIKRICDVTAGIRFPNPQEAIDTCVALIDCSPPSDVAPVRHGRWRYNSNDGTYHCPNCFSSVKEQYEVFDLEANDKADLNFCPNCGCKMDGGEPDA